MTPATRRTTTLICAAAVLWPTTGMADAAPPTQLACSPDEVHSFHVSKDAAGTPLRAGMSIAAGTRECDLSSMGAPTALPGGGWRFEWRDGGERRRIDIRRSGDGYTLAFEPAACGALRIPATATLAPKGKGCTESVDRIQAFVLFWRQLRDAIARDDGALLQRLAQPQVGFSEGDVRMKRPASVLREGASCLVSVFAPLGKVSLAEMLQATDTPRVDMRPVTYVNEGLIKVGGEAMAAVWTPQGWRISSLNASPAVFELCKSAG